MDFDKYIEDERRKNDPQDQKPYCYCDKCGTEIYRNEEYYSYEGDCLCEECFDEVQKDEKFESRRIAGDDDGD